MTSNLLNLDCDSDYSKAEKMDAEAIKTHLALVSGWKLVKTGENYRYGFHHYLKVNHTM